MTESYLVYIMSRTAPWLRGIYCPLCREQQHD